MNITEHEGRRYFTGWAGLDLHFDSWRPAIPSLAVVVLVHGYAEHHGRYQTTINRLVENGLTVYAYDQRGHGRSEGVRGDAVHFKDLVYDLAAMVDLAKEGNSTQRIFIIAHSLGASVAVNYASMHPELAGIVTTGIYVHDAEGYNPAKKVIVRALARIIPLVPIQYLDPKRIAVRTGAQDAYRTDPLVYHGNVRVRMGMHFLRLEDYLEGCMERITTPLLILHGEADQLSAAANSRMLYDLAPSTDKTHKHVEGCGHALLQDQDELETTDEVLSWILKRIKTDSTD